MGNFPINNIEEELFKASIVSRIKGIKARHQISYHLRKVSVQALTNMYSGADRSNLSIKTIAAKIIKAISQNEIVLTNLADLKAFDDYTYYHSVNITTFAVILGIMMKLTEDEIYELGIAAILHDIGKLFVDKSILNKKGELTSEEFEAIKVHSYLGYQFLKNRTDIPARSYMAVLQHHEKYNGKGYPHKANGTDICLFGRILCVVDAYDALTTDRCYRKALMPSEAKDYLIENCGIIFDPEIVSLFCADTEYKSLHSSKNCMKPSNSLLLVD